MKHELKMELRKLAKKNHLFNSIYEKASSIKTNILKKESDEEFLRRKFRENTGRELNLDNPQTYNEKMQWMKLYNRKPEYTQMVDKYGARQYVAEKLGEEYLIPLLGVWDSPDDIDFRALPNQLVLKCTHDCGGLVICRNKAKLNIPAAKKKLAISLRNNYFWVGREWPYKNVVPRIICEEYIEDKHGYREDEDPTPTLNAYKFLCFHGEPKVVVYTTDKPPDIRQNYFDMDFKPLDMSIGYSLADYPIEKPINFEEMKECARKLSAGIPHVRVDLYSISGRIYLSEFTFFNWGGMANYKPEEWDRIMGGWIALPGKRDP